MKLADLSTGPDWVVWIVPDNTCCTFYCFDFWSRELVYFWIQYGF